MSWVKKADIKPEMWHKPPQDDRDFTRNDEAHEMRSREPLTPRAVPVPQPVPEAPPKQNYLYEYKGYKYAPEYEESDDTRTVEHIVVLPNGIEMSADFSPYNQLTEESFQGWIDSGMPPRSGPGPLDAKDFAKTRRTGGWVKKADTMRDEPAGKSWQDFQQEHTFSPTQMTDPITEMEIKFKIPFLSTLPEKTLESMVQSSNALDPLSYQAYIETLTGAIVPLDKIAEFTKALEAAYNAMKEQARQEQS